MPTSLIAWNVRKNSASSRENITAEHAEVLFVVLARHIKRTFQQSKKLVVQEFVLIVLA